jgi:hypothetical protein
MIEEKKKESSSKVIPIIIGLIIALSILYWIGYFDDSGENYNMIKTEIQNQPDMLLPLCLSFSVFIFVVIALIWIALKKKHIFNKILESLKIMWLEIWAPFAVFSIMFLGWLHANYPYESYFRENITSSYTGMVNSTMTIYNYGTKFPGWGWTIIWIGIFGLGIWNIIDVWREPKPSDGLDKPKGLNTTKNLGEQHEKEENKSS